MSEKPTFSEEPLSIQDQKEEIEKIAAKNEIASQPSIPSYIHSVRFDPNSYSCDISSPSKAPGYLPASQNNFYQHEVHYFPNQVSSPPYEYNRSQPPYYNMPLKNIGFETRRRLGLYLNPEIVAAQNWKSLADELGFSYLEIKNLESERCKTEALLDFYCAQFPNATLGSICEIIDSKMQRHDVITDMSKWFERDFERYSRPSVSIPPSYIPAIENEIQKPEVTTTDDPCCHINNKFDGFVLYDVADRDFILKEFLPRLEDKEGIKLFIPERDLPVGVHSFDSRMNLMIQKSHKLVVILSDEFLKSKKSQWGLNLAVSIDPTARRQKIIPVIYKTIHETNILSGINACDRTQVLDDEWFWNNLIRSLGKSSHSKV